MPAYLVLIPVATLALGIFQILQVVLSRQQRYACQSSARIAKTVTESLTQLGAAIVAGVSPMGLVVGVVVGLVMQAALLLRATGLRLASLLEPVTGHRSVSRVAARHRNFPLFAVPSGVINIVGNHGFTLILVPIVGIESAGLFYLAHRVLALPTSLISQSLGPVFYQRLSAKRGDRCDEQLFITTVFVGLLAVGATVLIPVALVGPWAFELCFGPGWAESGQIVRAVWPSYLLMFAGLPITHAFYVYEKQKVNLFWQVAILALRIGGVYVAHAWGGFYCAMLAYGIVGVVHYTAVLVLSLRWAGCSFVELPVAMVNAVSKLAGRIAHELRPEPM
jgi:O-antigen/teichoic acid export membrane protein